ncbi:MAG: tRNA (adenosine(37)-N6)-threonylcarbamoyltransferase complex ATPase subunit type 1 TsaE [Bacteroidales bacterium]|nr:tRNA (adenosine(37)-N6)-threonylcarbamoyltransferase complex ATPase subunit type 1 TsaE [Bacteroidales bacterium]
MKILIKDKSYLPAAARKLLRYTSGKRVFAFHGPMGSGKTTIIKAICKELGAVDPVSSPTFTLANEYRTIKGEKIYHIDFFRIKNRDEIFDSGIEEYLSGMSYCFIEWPEQVSGVLPEEVVVVRITVSKDEMRILETGY